MELVKLMKLIEYKQGVAVDDPNRLKFQFITAFDSISGDNNFIDLDACIQNIFIYYEHNAYRQWADGEIDISKLSEFRREYKEEHNENN